MEEAEGKLYWLNKEQCIVDTVTVVWPLSNIKIVTKTKKYIYI